MPGALRPMGPPLDPTAEEARRWAEEELAKAIYSQGPSLWERFLTWLLQRWEDLMNLGGVGGAVLVPVLILALAAIVVTAAMLLGGPLRRRRVRTAAGASTQVLDDDERSADQLRAAADAAAKSGDHALAVLERFRAVVRGLDERGILTDRRGRTAREAAEQAGAAFGAQAEELRSAGGLFDAVYYGSALPGPGEDDWLRELDTQIARTRPVATSATDTARGWPVVR